MNTNYNEMSISELQDLLLQTQNKRDDAEDELALIREKSNSGQHMAGGYVSNNSERINDEIKELTLQIEKIKLEMENKIGGKNAEANG